MNFYYSSDHQNNKSNQILRSETIVDETLDDTKKNCDDYGSVLDYLRILFGASVKEDEGEDSVNDIKPFYREVSLIN